MRALVKTSNGPGGLEMLDVPVPIAGPRQVLMAVRAAAVCGTDVHIAHGTKAVRPPLVLGHELAGVVAACGEDVTEVHVGDRITTETDASTCGRCAHCLRGDQHLCALRTAIGTTADGGFAEFVVVPAAGTHRLPAHVDFVAGSLVEPLAVAVRAVIERADVQPAEVVVVIGPGTIGLLVAQVALARGAAVSVAGLRRHRDRFRLAREMGVRRTIVLDEDAGPAADGAPDPPEADTVFECSGAPEALGVGLRLLRKGGRLVAVGLAGGRDTHLDVDLLVNHELTLLASRGKRPGCFRVAIDLLDAGRVDPGRLVTHRFGLEEWEEAFETAGRSGTKVVFEIGRTAPA
jgi:L-iditol 2-dehydrogenase